MGDFKLVVTDIKRYLINNFFWLDFLRIWKRGKNGHQH